MQKHNIGLAGLALALLLAGCGKSLTFAPELGIDLSQFRETQTGLYIEDVTVGTGQEAMSGDTVFINYTAYFVNGVKLDSTEGRSPFRFVLDSGDVILGVNEGVTGMKVGGERKLVIPPDLGYGFSDVQRDSTWIPGGSTLVYDITLVDLHRPKATTG
ncbi:MAG: FKBP-type peptidyl-prolyl cis-trans isomerase [Gemmatimonadota bacterium]|jgi:FKBP-type peptidyl-prolyl cis-trans isomerase FkpA